MAEIVYTVTVFHSYSDSQIYSREGEQEYTKAKGLSKLLFDNDRPESGDP